MGFLSSNASLALARLQGVRALTGPTFSDFQKQNSKNDDHGGDAGGLAATSGGNKHAGMTCDQLGNDLGIHNGESKQAQYELEACRTGKHICTPAQVEAFTADLVEANAAAAEIVKEACHKKCEFANESLCRAAGYGWG